MSKISFLSEQHLKKWEVKNKIIGRIVVGASVLVHFGKNCKMHCFMGGRQND
jgi:hypothetical protein